MKPQQAHDYFSAYFEGSLPEPLKEQFEAMLEREPQIAIEYAQFVAAVSALEDWGDQEIEVPADLRERIARRVDRIEWEQKQQRSFLKFGNWRLGFIGGLALVAIAATVMSINRGNSNGFEAGTASTQTASQSVRFDFEVAQGAPILQVYGSKPDKIFVVRYPADEVLQTIDLKPNQKLTLPLSTKDPSGTVLEVRSENSKTKAYIALHGVITSEKDEDQGSVLEFAQTLANRLQKNVLIEAQEPREAVQWKFVGEGATDVEFQGKKFTIQVGSSFIRLGG